ncbi:thiamine pyrophosphate-binding protein [Pseudomonas fluorescens]|uniref:Acetolactate synthase isozyme 3 large subunit n=1 Tax=Pseudomonas fluorescens TaxID=294 RepID=A0A5E7FUS9_PSEFL|nr:thiamine pyrophosphate-binding protein [Pseudomonas fluorescens]VVO42975.1 Acetolactate synthase isozyme 3 large subunit [Pseudomonas fluorescens]
MKLTGSQTLARLLKAHGVEYVAGIPGYGSWTLVDALQSAHEIPFIQVMQEQSSVHMADGYYRACGRPMAALLPTATGVSKALGGLACAYAEGSAMLVISGGQLSHLPGTDTTQDLRGAGAAHPPRTLKARLVTETAADLPTLLRAAFSTMVSPGPGPVSIEIPVAVQAQSVEFVAASVRAASARFNTPAQQIAQAAEWLLKAVRPVIVAGSGVMMGDACNELLAVAERFCMPVLTRANGKGAIAEDHPLAGGCVGRSGSPCANRLLAEADLILLLGSELADFESRGLVIRIDGDLARSSRVGQVELGIEADTRSALAALVASVSAPQHRALALQRAAYLKHMTELRADWEARLDNERADESSPFIVQRPLAELRAVLERDAIVVVGTGSVGDAMVQMFPVFFPRTHLSSTGFGAQGWAVPAAIGAKLAMPARQVVCVVGDGDFLQSMQEMAVCVMHCIPVLFMVFNNSGYSSLRDARAPHAGRYTGSEFNLPDGKPYSPEFAEVARSFGLESWRVEHPYQLSPALHKALNSKGPALVEVMISRESRGALDAFSDDVP